MDPDTTMQQCPLTLAVDFTHTVRAVESMLTSCLGQEARLTTPLPSHPREHVRTLCANQNQKSLQIILVDADPTTHYKNNISYKRKLDRQ